MSDWLRPEAWRSMLSTPSLLRSNVRSRFSDLFGQLASVLSGRPLELELGGANLFAVIESVRAVAPEKAQLPTIGAPVVAFESLTMGLRHVQWGTRRVRAAEVTVRDVAMVYDPVPVLRTGPIEVVAYVEAAAVGGWLAELEAPFAVELDAEEGLVISRASRYLDHRALVEPSLSRQGLHLTIRRLEVLGRDVPLPRSFGLTVTFPLPPLPASARLVDLRVVDGELVMEATRPHLDREIGLEDVVTLLGTAGRTAGAIRVSREGQISVG